MTSNPPRSPEDTIIRSFLSYAAERDQKRLNSTGELTDYLKKAIQKQIVQDLRVEQLDGFLDFYNAEWKRVHGSPMETVLPRHTRDNAANSSDSGYATDPSRIPEGNTSDELDSRTLRINLIPPEGDAEDPIGGIRSRESGSYIDTEVVKRYDGWEWKRNKVKINWFIPEPAPCWGYTWCEVKSLSQTNIVLGKDYLDPDLGNCELRLSQEGENGTGISYDGMAQDLPQQQRGDFDIERLRAAAYTEQGQAEMVRLMELVAGRKVLLGKRPYNDHDSQDAAVSKRRRPNSSDE
ncbi:hypothetical protein GQ53DRAFT_765013 [Thozetella sp. PMI_491]|nr:hypothetical protein GQ53DRAFT_765013 [Thozetella sp. PMI_491]